MLLGRSLTVVRTTFTEGTSGRDMDAVRSAMKSEYEGSEALVTADCADVPVFEWVYENAVARERGGCAGGTTVPGEEDGVLDTSPLYGWTSMMPGSRRCRGPRTSTGWRESWRTGSPGGR
ncbi:hypothetical protein GCM10009755_11860 [Brevibacterium samyangense]|uniref:Uncharacterized protein n=1 Tax=Brevibacterium samyangense TaxID=366888 RepID=A0ABP5ETF2_9MICO